MCITLKIMISGKGLYLSKFKKYSLTILFLLCIVHSALSQRNKEEPPPLRERLFFGGSFGLQFGTITDIEFSPVAGFWLLPRLAFAAGPNFRYYKFLDSKTNIYGGKGYLQLVVVQNISNILPIGGNIGIFLHLENEFLSLESSFWKNPPYVSERFYVNTVLTGPGISQQIGRRSSMNFAVLWALNDSRYSVYSNPEIRIIFHF